ncbi:helix-turn-helix transcriptional regulator [Crossiella sp. S99.2]|uniref:helix-turn-helix domain-containing protein n=1 Tax=Crossiella sp. S99.2 TaxID=2936272 RepID=UPI0027E438C0|nr:helix-turn-helix transcriptional regulator [Crossiella sp. S99.2]
MFSPPRLRAHRHRQGMTAHALAHRAGVGTDWVEAVESGAHNPTPEKVAAVAEALQITPEQLYAPEPEARDNRQYWAAVAATAPPMTTRDIDSVGAILRRISRRDETT